MYQTCMGGGVINNGTEYVPMFDMPPAYPSISHPWLDVTLHVSPCLVLDEIQFKEEKQYPKYKVKEPEPQYDDASPPAIDWDLYRCKDCGQILAGFVRYEHVRDAHKGIDSGFDKIKEH